MDNLLSAIKNRATTKVLSQTPWAPSLEEKDREILIDQLLELAAAAPYHYESAAKYRAELSSSLPFRYYVADAKRCREAVHFAAEHDVDSGKIGGMLLTAEVLMMVTWLPDVFGEPAVGREPIPFTGNLRNMEHVAAAAASIQNVLVGASAMGYPTYWSSGGILRFNPMRGHLQVPEGEILLGALFIFPEDALEHADEVITGKLRHKGKEIDTWSKRV